MIHYFCLSKPPSQYHLVPLFQVTYAVYVLPLFPLQFYNMPPFVPLSTTITVIYVLYFCTLHNI